MFKTIRFEVLKMIRSKSFLSILILTLLPIAIILGRNYTLSAERSERVLLRYQAVEEEFREQYFILEQSLLFNQDHSEEL